MKVNLSHTLALPGGAQLNETEQEYLLYVRYSTIPIEPEPFSESNSKDTFEVSAKPYLKGKIKKDKLQLLRAQLEHLQTLYWLDHLVQHSSLKTTRL
ncbi:hypothetical protein VCRA2119O147_760014 [Vibrio crassostreae]|uniref:Uncharacterized protein n=2 Tax=Vibrio TaxID=662 RepID=A0A822N5T0_9VIBR|nr:conserved hypothetical protein [Vibrio chagasii]CAK1898087.1 hypothetical protein VCRA2112O187_210021 [Vibrio crassostreae]CDT48121.1 hypothetical protein VCR29J2_350016 [Vibrio coralliirubri]CAH7190264.1 conserved hypothetical protein [Vibrio chagasii]CAH7225047.1 conserved hypothetical protein [Vibrio chagasii]